MRLIEMVSNKYKALQRYCYRWKEYLHFLYFFYLGNNRMKILCKKELEQDKIISIDQNNTAIYICENFSFRLVKISKGLKKNGWKVILLCEKNIAEKNCITEDHSEYYDFLIVFKTTDELLKIVYRLKETVQVIHCFTPWGACYNANILIRYKEMFPPIVVERYDILNGFYTKNKYRKNYAHDMEKYAFTHADGICAREFGLEYMERSLGLKIVSDRITFLDNIDEFAKIAEYSVDCKKTELQLCYVGRIWSEKNYPGSIFACNLELARLCEKNKVHYHIYPSIWDENDFSDLLMEDNKNPYFHLHRPLPYQELIDEISKYDYGIIACRKNFREQLKKTGYKDAKIDYAGTNKFFDYLAAGLPILAPFPAELINEISKHGVIIKWSIDDYNFNYLRAHKKEFREKVIKEREFWLMENQIKDLINFYQALKKSRRK